MKSFLIIVYSLVFLGGIAQNTVASTQDLSNSIAKHQSTLLDFQVGMTAQVDVRSEGVNHNLLTDQVRPWRMDKSHFNIILHVDNANRQYYAYSTRRDLASGREFTYVYLESFDHFTKPNLRVFDVQLSPPELTFEIQRSLATAAGIIEARESVVLNVFASAFCDFQKTISWAEISTDYYVEGEWSTDSSCGEVLPREELEKIDLSKVVFCDKIDEAECIERDLSFLTSLY